MIDTHAHLTYTEYGDISLVINDAYAAGVKKIINAGYDLASSAAGKDLADKFDGVYFAAGVHPSETDGNLSDEDVSALCGMFKHHKCVAVGEIGLDYHYEPTDKPAQKRAFERQLSLAYEAALPVIIHSRDDVADMLDLLTHNKELLRGGVMHCYSHSKESAKQFLDLGLYISFSGTVTYKNAVNLQDAAKYVPLDRILAETDCPYLSPVPLRGKQNRPQNVMLTLQKLAQLKNITDEELESIIWNNAHALFCKLD